MGYSQYELDHIQESWRLRFPPDLVELLQKHRPLLDGPASFDWLLSEAAKIEDWLDWFDVERGQA